MRRLLMISPHFPPDSTAATHRVRLLAPHLPSFGWEPTVLAVDQRDYGERLDPLLGDSVPQAVRVVRARAWSRDLTRVVGIGDLGLRAYLGLRREALRLVTAEQYDAVFVTTYPTYPALIGRMLKARFGLAFVLDLQDPWVGEWGKSVGGGYDGRPDWRSRASRLVASRLEPLAVGSADAITAVSRKTYEDALARTPCAAPAATAELPIGWDPTDWTFVRAQASSRGRWDGDGLVHLVYVGTLLPTGIDTVRALFAAVARLRSERADATRLRLHFFGTSNQRGTDAPGRVGAIARAAGLDAVVTEVPERLDYFEALGVLADASAVLVLGTREPHYTPSKAYPALLSGRPVIAAVHEDSDAARFLRRAAEAPALRLSTYGDGSPALDRSDEIAELIAGFLDQPSYERSAVNWTALDDSSACALARRLAGVLDEARRHSCSALPGCARRCSPRNGVRR